jgi:hypothetical protein
MVKNRASAGAGVLEMSGAIDDRREGVVTAATGVAAGGSVNAAMTIGCDATALPAAMFSTTGILLAAVALVSTAIAAAATKPKNSTTGSHWAAYRARFFALMLNTPRPGR